MIYAGASAADEFAMEALRGVAYTFKVINEDTTAVTKTWANSRLQVILTPDWSRRQNTER